MPTSRRRPQRLSETLLATSTKGQVTAKQLADAAENSFSVVPHALLIPTERIIPNPDNPRKAFDGLEELAASIAERGLLQPLIVRRDPARPGSYVAIAGSRRLMAARIVQGSDEEEERVRVAELPCLIMEETEEAAFADALVENLARADLSRAETMAALLRLKTGYGWTVRYIARRTGRSLGDVSELLNLAMDEDVAPLVGQEIISPTTAIEIRRLPRAIQPQAIKEVHARRLKTVDDVRRFRRSNSAPPSDAGTSGETLSSDPARGGTKEDPAHEVANQVFGTEHLRDQQTLSPTRAHAPVQAFGTEHLVNDVPETRELAATADEEQAAIIAVQAIQRLVEYTGVTSAATRAALEHASRLLLAYLGKGKETGVQ